MLLRHRPSRLRHTVMLAVAPITTKPHPPHWLSCGALVPLPWTVKTLLMAPSQLTHPAILLAKELFVLDAMNHHRVMLTKTPSKPSYHLRTAEQLAHVFGLALSQANDVQIEQCLVHIGIKTNHVDNIWTGVSLARFKRLIAILRAGVVDNKENTPITAHVYLRAVWDKCGLQYMDKFIETLQQHYPITSLQHAPTDVKLLETLFHPIARALNNSYVKPGIHVVRQTRDFFDGSASSAHVYDCVEVVLREVIEFLLFDDERGMYAMDRLPPTTVHPVRNFLQALMRGKSPNELSQQWWDVCQNLRDPAIEYLCVTDKTSRIRYELMPCSRTIARVLGELLMGRSISSMEDFCVAWNQTCPKYQISMTRRMETFRPALSEESVSRELVQLHAEQDNIGIELCLERQHRLASVRRVSGGHATPIDNITDAIAHIPETDMTKSLAASVLKYTLWSERAWKYEITMSAQDVMLGMVCTRWDRTSRHPVFEPYGTAAYTLQEQEREDRIALMNAIDALHAMASVASKKREEFDAKNYLRWLLILNKDLLRKKMPHDGNVHHALARVCEDWQPLVQEVVGLDMTTESSKGWLWKMMNNIMPN